MLKTVLPIIGWLAIAYSVLFCGVSAIAAWRAHHGHGSSGGFAVVSAISALMLYQTGSRALRSQRQAYLRGGRRHRSDLKRSSKIAEPRLASSSRRIKGKF